MPCMRLKEIGEFELIERMARIFQQDGAAVANAAAAFSRLVVGIGDDAAVWRESSSQYTMSTTDAMVEGVHFTCATTDWYDLGWKAMASNISDIAGMGGIPRYALVVLGASGELEVTNVLDLCRGMADLAGRFGAAIIGGDTISSPLTMVSITVLGEAVRGQDRGGAPPILRRSAACPGDWIAVTGRLGSSAGGLELLLKGSGRVDAQFAPLAEAHRRPVPRVEEGQLLVSAGVRCGMDLSDGLIGDLTRICRASGVSALVEVDKLPVDPLLREAFGERAVELALSGGEDYELLCAAPAEILSEAQLLLHRAGVDLTVVGTIVDRDLERAPVMLCEADGQLRMPTRKGWEHFTSNGDSARD